MYSTTTILQSKKRIFVLPVKKEEHTNDLQRPPVFSGTRQKLIRLLIWLNILVVSLYIFRNPYAAIIQTKRLLRFRNKFRNGHTLKKYARSGNRYFFTYNAPGWPSAAFNRYIRHQLKNIKDGVNNTSIHTLLFGITKKCGFKCEHCCEWENLNKPEVLSVGNMVEIVHRFQQLGVTQIQLSGGEPMNRFQDILFLLDNAKKGTDFWILTSGYNFTADKAILLKQHGLTGITISLDHCDEALHDAFRGVTGSFKRVFHAAACARHAGLAICFSICATKKFIALPNLLRYAELAKEAGASFIQILEPQAVGHYARQVVSLPDSQINQLEQFYELMNYDEPSFIGYPIISYHGYYSRRIGCAGSGKDFLYVDTDGDVHSCSFCQHKLFSALDEGLSNHLQQLKRTGCAVFGQCEKK
ncbi:MAG: radical SAM protein [Bacteroidota bacterium]